MATKTINARLGEVELWWKGNGVKGAEDRLRWLEENAMTQEKVEAIIDSASRKTAHEIVASARQRDMTSTAKIKAWAPYFATACALLTAVLTAVFK